MNGVLDVQGGCLHENRIYHIGRSVAIMKMHKLYFYGIKYTNSYKAGRVWVRRSVKFGVVYTLCMAWQLSWK